MATKGSSGDGATAETPLDATAPEIAALATEREQLLAELKALGESELLHRLVVDSMASGVVVLDGEGRVVRCNASAERILGARSEELLSQRFLDARWSALRDDGSPWQQEDLPTAVTLRTGSSTRGSVIGVTRPTGGVTWIATHTDAITRDDRVESVIASFTDITERRRIREKLSERDAQIHLALEATRMGVWDWLIGERLSWSTETETLFGLEPGTFESTFDAFMMLVHPEDRAAVTARMSAAVAPGRDDEDFEIEHRVVRPDGEVRWVESRGRVVRDHDGNATGMRGVVRDSTEHKQLEEQLLQSQKMELVGRLAGGIAHDFNNLLTAIGGAIELARLDPGRRDAHLDDATNAVGRAAHLTRQLLTFAKKNQVELRPLNPRAVFERTAGLLRHLLQETLSIETRLAPELGSIRADAVLLEQVLVNLAVNAGDAMPHGGRLSIYAKNVSLDRHDQLPPGEYVELVVADSGSGIAEGDLPRIFEPFYTTKSEGTGLGLSTVYGIVKQLGGCVEVDSSAGRGTTFTITLPRCDDTRAIETERTSASRVAGSATILAVEDNPMVRRVLAQILDAHGYQVLLAEDAEVALKIADEQTAIIHAVVTDVVMPKMSGPDLVRELRRRRPGIKALLTSGYAGETLDLPTLGPGTVFLQKPYHAGELTAQIEALLGS